MATAYVPELIQTGTRSTVVMHDRLIYLAPTPWASFSQRPHELVRCFHEQTGGEVLWVDPYPTRLPNPGDLLHRPHNTLAAAPRPAWLRVIRPTALPIEPLPGSAYVNRWLWRDVVKVVLSFSEKPTLLIVGKPSQLALQLMREPTLWDSRYDAMDDVAMFYCGISRWAMARRERETVLAARHTFCSASSLQQRLKKWAKDPAWVANACAVERLPEANISRRARGDGPLIFGYVGVIAKWFDWALVIALAAARPEALVRLIGPVFGPLPPGLPRNIEILPECEHALAMEAMREFDLGLIPFRITPLTAGVDPIKYYEYRALGIPILSSRFGEMAQRGQLEGVFIADDVSRLDDLIGQAIAYGASPESISRFRAENAWSVRFAQANLFVR